MAFSFGAGEASILKRLVGDSFAITVKELKQLGRRPGLVDPHLHVSDSFNWDFHSHCGRI